MGLPFGKHLFLELTVQIDSACADFAGLNLEGLCGLDEKNLVRADVSLAPAPPDPCVAFSLIRHQKCVMLLPFGSARFRAGKMQAETDIRQTHAVAEIQTVDLAVIVPSAGRCQLKPGTQQTVHLLLKVCPRRCDNRRSESQRSAGCVNDVSPKPSCPTALAKLSYTFIRV